MSAGPGSIWISVQMSPQEKERLDAAVRDAKASNPNTSRNRFLRDFIATLPEPSQG